MIHFKDAVGMLWYALLLAQESHEEQQHQPIWNSVACTKEDVAVKKDTAAGGEGYRQSSGDAGGDSGSDPKGGTGASIPAISLSTSTTVSLSTAVQRSDCEFDSWGDVDWTLLAAHVYALTGELHSARALHRVVAEDMYKGTYNGNREAMCAACALQHAEMLAFYAKEVQEEEERAATVRLQTPLTVSAGMAAGGSRLAGAAGVLQSDSSLVASSSTAGAHGARLPVTAGIRGPPSSLQSSSSGGGSAAPSLPSTRSDARASSLTPTQWGSASTMPRTAAVSHPASPCTSGATQTTTGETIADVRVAGLHASAGASTATRAPGSLPPPSQRDRDVVGLYAAGGTGRAVSADHGELSALPPHARPGSVAGVPQHCGLAVADQSAAIFGESLDAGVAHMGDHTVLPFTVQPPSSFEPDPLDAPWYALWCSLPSPQARAQLQLLRYATPLPLEDFSSLLEQFFLVDGADDFLSPVHAATIMEFAGVRSGPYNTIVRYPLSLAEVRRYISESHRQYARAVMTVHANHAGGAASVEARSRPPFGQPSPNHASGLATSSTLETSHAAAGGRGLSAPSVPTATKAEYRGLRRGGAPSAGTPGSDVCALLDSSASSERRILTLAELERSVWHVAANCAVFNAPESRYPRTARHFAAACITVMTRYCEKQLASFFAA
ncbi:conserved hypothetical protein [Leishmania mexicana MHOM/GT/2001/U1103]|uniref:Bromo domain-containing protein n=1 Tax=Leishmania mexicana (strain MHOM/GT/2001/U1103) TaxID=929439 RepID=E9ANX1_LEIMU|nr:conserved hypothetical protein [Leishmania mexicana MHOM/GT/2001/U1103]CBZ24635.1 conserved hypothetical protein [Leishmania mexicana MHOM/GT/2001/U1103]